MSFNKEKHHRQSIRLKGWDYSGAGIYFVTICAWKKECLFDNGIVASIIKEQWQNLPKSNVGAQFIAPSEPQFIAPNSKTTEKQGVMNQRKGVMNHAPTIGEIVRAFKARCTHMINDIRSIQGTPVWQRNYYEHIIRNEDELNRIRRYIIENHLKWDEDPENPKNINKKLETIWG